MRVTGGKYRGRQIAVPKGRDVRPTTDKVRQAMFNIIGGYELAEGPFILDAFCGTGALGIEALSRYGDEEGCRALFWDKSRESLDFCSENISAIGLTPQAQIARADATKPPVLMASRGGNRPADLVFLDPPYNKGLVPVTLAGLIDKGWLAPSALCVMECEKGADLSMMPQDIAVRDDRTYGECRIIIARYERA